MNFFKDEKRDKLISMLKQSKPDFKFDPNSGKVQLMQSLTRSQIVEPEMKMHSWHIMRYSLATACLLIFVSGTFAFASNAKPGDKLFPMNKLGEQMILKLPLTDEVRANFQARIVSKRLEALTQVKPEAKLETIKESDESLNQAVEAITTNRQNLRTKGNKQAEARLNNVLNQLESLAQKQQERIEVLQSETDDTQVRLMIDQHLLRVKQAKQKAILELNVSHEQD